MPLTSKPILTLDVAKQIAAAAQAEAINNSWNVCIAIVDPAGLLVYFQKLDDTQLGSVEVSQAKARCAALYKRPSKALADVVTGGNVGMMGLPGVVAVEGGLPLFADGQIVGAIGISGVMSNQDGIVAKAGVDAFAAIAGA
ncbi:MAG: heme-binding protein [Acidobacteria bacterium]|nr:heme-binding protein [Acidobacteriota bacterium]MDA1235329.1 heme-binding protein [Acidobacteriota bacterium]